MGIHVVATWPIHSTIERFVCGSDAAFLSNYFDHFLVVGNLNLQNVNMFKYLGHYISSDLTEYENTQTEN